MKKYNYYSLLLLSFIVLSIASCAPADATSIPYGIFYGILHGIAFPFALISKLYTSKYALYAISNTGALYWAGYVIGLVGFWGGGIWSRR